MASELELSAERRGLARGEEKGLVKGRAEGRAEGRVEGQAEFMLMLLAAKGLHVDDSSRQLIASCRDPATLKRWLDRALAATRLEEVLDGPAQ